MKVYVKNMVCGRCKTVVRNELEKLGIEIIEVNLGEIIVAGNISNALMNSLDKRLKAHGFEILRDKEGEIIEQVKKIIIKLVYEDGGEKNKKLSEVITLKIRRDYSAISKLFSEIEGITIEKYLINVRIERVKELLMYDELSLSEIAFRLNYSSVAYLSNQFKKVTGLSPSFFKKLKENKRKSIDEV
ncbi:helix-turn-helix domain-containing protein [Lewinella sp. LCG006]|uniref:helix-turn-helix domain-containing protein n=1 Tax=Lewinella sp. LCG006 TaxID=3231911 RepID=UPI00345FBC56